MFWTHKYLKCIFKLKKNVLPEYFNFIRLKKKNHIVFTSHPVVILK